MCFAFILHFTFSTFLLWEYFNYSDCTTFYFHFHLLLLFIVKLKWKIIIKCVLENNTQIKLFKASSSDNDIKEMLNSGQLKESEKIYDFCSHFGKRLMSLLTTILLLLIRFNVTKRSKISKSHPRLNAMSNFIYVNVLVVYFQYSHSHCRLASHEPSLPHVSTEINSKRAKRHTG